MKCFQFILLVIKGFKRKCHCDNSRRFGAIVRVMDRKLLSVVRIISCTRTELTIQLNDERQRNDEIKFALTVHGV